MNRALKPISAHGCAIAPPARSYGGPSGASSKNVEVCRATRAPPSVVHRILLVDDDVALRRILTRFLTRAGYVVFGFDSADAALANLDADAGPAILVTDFMMPGMTGDALAELVEERRPDVPRLIMSGTFPASLTVRAAWLLKPFSGAQLVDAVGQLAGLESSSPSPGASAYVCP